MDHLVTMNIPPLTENRIRYAIGSVAGTTWYLIILSGGSAAGDGVAELSLPEPIPGGKKGARPAIDTPSEGGAPSKFRVPAVDQFCSSDWLQGTQMGK